MCWKRPCAIQSNPSTVIEPNCWPQQVMGKGITSLNGQHSIPLSTFHFIYLIATRLLRDRSNYSINLVFRFTSISFSIWPPFCSHNTEQRFGNLYIPWKRSQSPYQAWICRNIPVYLKEWVVRRSGSLLKKAADVVMCELVLRHPERSNGFRNRKVW